VPATLLHLLRFDCLNATPPLGSPLAIPTTRYSPARFRLSPQQYLCTVGVCKHPLTAQMPQMHPSYHRGPATSAAPSLRDSVPATLPHLRRSRCLQAPPPLGSLLAIPTTRYSPARNRSGPQHAASSMHSRRSQAPAHTPAAANARSAPPRSSDVSDAIVLRLGASDAAPSAPTSFPARTAAPRLAPRNPHHPLEPRAQPLRPNLRNIIHKLPAFPSTRSQRSCRKCTQHTVELQRLQLRHPSETWCQRRCPCSFDIIVGEVERSKMSH
jgi:hypothetical protein